MARTQQSHAMVLQEPYDEEKTQLMEAADASGKILRFVGIVDVEHQTCEVKLEQFPKTHAFAGTQWADNIVAFHTAVCVCVCIYIYLYLYLYLYICVCASSGMCVCVCVCVCVCECVCACCVYVLTFVHTHSLANTGTHQRYVPQPLVVKGPGAGAAVTAAGLYAEVIKIVDCLH